MQVLDFNGSDHRALWLERVGNGNTNTGGRRPKEKRRFHFDPLWMMIDRDWSL